MNELEQEEKDKSLKKCLGCEERAPSWKAFPTAEYEEEYPGDEWYFCDECMQDLLGSVWSGGGPFANDFIAFVSLDARGEPFVDLKLLREQRDKEKAEIVKDISDVYHAWRQDRAGLKKEIARIKKVLLEIRHAMPGDGYINGMTWEFAEEEKKESAKPGEGDE